jgi:very-short-patch-repair endonuclease
MLAGMDELTVNEDIYDRHGRFLARADLVVRGARLIIEYQGDHHRDPVQYRKDLTRRSKLEAEAWTVVELGARDLDDPVELVARLRAIVAARI